MDYFVADPIRLWFYYKQKGVFKLQNWTKYDYAQYERAGFKMKEPIGTKLGENPR